MTKQHWTILLIAIALLLLGNAYFDFANLKSYQRNWDITRISPKLIAGQKKFNSNQMYLTMAFRAIMGGGKLCNQMFEIASMVGIAASTNRQPFFPAKLENFVGKMTKDYFINFKSVLVDSGSLPKSTKVNFGNRGGSTYDNVSALLNNTNEAILLSGIYFQSYKYFDHVREKILKLYAFHLRDVKTADENFENQKKQLEQISEQNIEHLTCVHIRRGDFVNDPVLLESRAGFLIGALKLLANLSSNDDLILLNKSSEGINRHFLILGDDRQWARNVIIASKSHLFPRMLNHILVPNQTDNKIHDLIIFSKHCDSILLTCGGSTFGFWGSYLAAKNVTVYYNPKYSKSNHNWYFNGFTPSDFYLPRWIPLNLSVKI